MSKTVYLRPFAVISQGAWGLGAGAGIIAAVDPGYPPTDDDDSSYVYIEQPNTNSKLILSLTDKPNDILKINSVKIVTRDRFQDDSASMVPAIELLGNSTDASPYTTTGYATRTTAALARPGGGDWKPEDIAEPTLYMSLRATSFGTPSPSVFTYLTTWKVELNYEPIPAQDTSARDAVSRRRWLSKHGQRVIKRKLPLNVGLKVGLLDVVMVSHRDGPHPDGIGWRSRPWERRPFRVVGRTTNLEDGTVDLQLRDLSRHLCLFHTTARAKNPSPAADGVGFFSAGALLDFSRSGKAWIADQSGGSLFVRCEADRPRYGLGIQPETGEAMSGLVIEPAGFNSLAHSSFKQQLLGWTTSNGSGVVSAATSPLRFDAQESGYVLKIVAGSPHSTRSTARSSATGSYPANSVFPIWISTRTANGATAGPGIVIQRQVDSFYYTVATQSWGATRVVNPVPASSSWRETFLLEIDIGGSASTVTIEFSVEAGAPSGSEYYVGHCQIDSTRYPTSPIITEGSGAGRVDADHYLIRNYLGARSIHEPRGVLAYRYAPNYDDAVTGASQYNTHHIFHDGSNYFECYWSPGNHRWQVDWVAGGVTYQAYSDAVLPQRGVPIEFGFRWTSDDDELDLGGRTLSFFLNGARVSDVGIADLTESDTSTFQLDGDQNNAGTYQDIISLATVPTDAEMARLPRV